MPEEKVGAFICEEICQWFMFDDDLCSSLYIHVMFEM